MIGESRPAPLRPHGSSHPLCAGGERETKRDGLAGCATTINDQCLEPFPRGRKTGRVVDEGAHVPASLDHRPFFLRHLPVVPHSRVSNPAELPVEWISPLASPRPTARPRGIRDVGPEGTFVLLDERGSQSASPRQRSVVPRRLGDALGGFSALRQRCTIEEEAARTRHAFRHAVARLEGRRWAGACHPAERDTPSCDRSCAW
jgi:hypothetical protein